jgi:methyl-accepting chemotaxis protein
MITGDASLEFVKLVNYPGKIEEINPDIPLVGGAPSDLMNGFSNIEGDLTKAINSVADAAGNLGGFIDRVNSAIGTPEEFQARQRKFEAIVDESRSTMASMRQLTDGANRFVGDPEIQQQVRKILNDLPEVIEKSRTLVGESTNFVQDARSLVERGNTSLDKLSGGLEKVAKLADTIVNLSDKIEGDVPEIVTAIKKSAVKLESLFDEITMIIEGVRNSDGTVKRLMRDPALYEKVLATLDNVEQITDEVNMILQTDMKPIANNVKLLTDKAARDPAIFIRNLIRKEPPTKVLPFWGDSRSCSSHVVQPDDTIIEETIVVEPVMPIRAAHVLKRTPSPQPLPRLHTIKQVVAEDVVPNEGRVISVDPRYPNAVNGEWTE